MAAVVPHGSADFIGRDGRVTAQHQAGMVRIAASTIKLPLILEVLRQEEDGTLDLATPYMVRREDVVGGSGELQRQVGRIVTLRELARLTVVHSDNVAANVLLDKVGMDRVNTTMQHAGFQDTRFERHFLDTAAQARGLENWTTAGNLADMLRQIWEGKLLSATISERARDLLKERGERDREWLGLALPRNTVLYHINGTLDHVRNDAGIVEFDTGQVYVLVVCQDHLVDDATGERAITELARRVHALATAPKDRLP